jgi:hypothetical protein
MRMDNGHTPVTGVRDISGTEFPMCLEGDRLYFEGGTLDLRGIGQLQVALDQAAAILRLIADHA